MAEVLGLGPSTTTRIGLADLPKEILQQIAWECSDRKDAFHLSLVNNQVHDALTGTLERRLLLTRNTTWEILKHLYDRSDLAPKVKEVSLSNIDCPRTTGLPFKGTDEIWDNLRFIENGTFLGEPEVIALWRNVFQEMEKYTPTW